ncbi:hypothetical protein PTI98_004802 [Pleurotus ostreatus]|nr:hypothetical protein PTI98_004802 [Pleurotus ostreatus]
MHASKYTVVAYSNATNIRTSLRREGGEIVINGDKCGAGDIRTRVHSPGIRVIRPMKVFGYDDAPKVIAKLSTIMASKIIKAVSGLVAFIIACAPLVPLQLPGMLQRVTDPAKKTFGSVIALSAALQIDNFTAKGALKEIGIAKFFVPPVALGVIDRTIQTYGAEGVCQDQHLAKSWAELRTMWIADGPDAVVERAMARKEKEILEKAGLRSKSHSYL